MMHEVTMKKIYVLLLALLCAAPAGAAESTRCFNADGPKLSVQSGVVRDGLRLLLRVPGLEGDNFLRAARNYVNSESSWKAPRGYTITRAALKNCGAELLHRRREPRERAVLLLHGGAYILKLSNIYRGMAVRYSRMAGDADVFSRTIAWPRNTSFRRPWTTPGRLELAAGPGYKPENILVVGDSAGGNLALALTLSLRDAGRPLPRAWSACRRGRI